jgi:hypothetical protein
MSPRFALRASRWALCAALFVVLLTCGLLVRAQSGVPSPELGTGYDLSWWTVDGGGDVFGAGGSYVLGGTAGQPDAQTLSTGDYVLTGGFWAGAATTAYDLYLPLLLRNN